MGGESGDAGGPTPSPLGRAGAGFMALGAKLTGDGDGGLAPTLRMFARGMPVAFTKVGKSWSAAGLGLASLLPLR